MNLNGINYINPIFCGRMQFGSKQKSEPINKDVFEKNKGISFTGRNKSFGLRLEDASLAAYLSAHSSKRFRKSLFEIKLPIREYNLRFKNVDTSILPGIDVINKRLEQSGIGSTTSLNYFLKIYNNPNVQEAFYTHEVKLLDIYSKLNNKEDLTNFPNILFGLYILSKVQEKEFEPTSVTEFLKSVGVNNENDLPERFSYIAEYFNNFEDLEDILDTIDYLRETYPKKIDLINSALDKQCESKKISAENFYKNFNDIIDYLYEENNEKSLEPLSDIADSLIKCTLLKKYEYKILPFPYDDKNIPEEKINFFTFLNENNITFDMFKQLSAKNKIEGYEVASAIENKDNISGEIAEIKGISREKAEEHYIKYADLYSCVDPTLIKSVSDFIDKFDIAHTDSVLSIYNKVYGVNKKKLSAEELNQLVEFMSYCESKDVMKEAKANKILPCEIIEKNKENFYSVKNAIEQFIINDDTEYFLGQSPYSIYSEYKEIFLENPDDVKYILADIVNLNISDSTDYKLKMDRTHELSQYFDNRAKFTEFVLKNNIKFELSKEDNKRIEKCKKMFSLVKDDKEALRYFTNSDFISKSQNSLDDFFKNYPNENRQKEMLKFFAQRKVPSYFAFKSFLNKYKSGKDSCDNIITHLNNQKPDITFARYSSRIEMINKEIKNLGLPFNVNNSNILKLSMYDDIKDIVNILNKLTGAKENELFISKLSSSFKPKKHDITSYDIAEEMATQLKTKEPCCFYNNIADKFGLTPEELGIDSEDSDLYYKMTLAQALPQDFIKFVNSDDWFNFTEGKTPPNISLHARLRLIDRFCLDGEKTADDLYTEETSRDIKKLLKTIYTATPVYVIGSGYDKSSAKVVDLSKKGIIMRTMYNSDPIDTVYTPQGHMVTIINKNK